MLGLICIVGKRVSIGYSCLSGTYMQHIWIKLEPRPFCALQSMPLGQEYASIHARGSPTMVGSLSACHSSCCCSPYYLHHSHCPLHLAPRHCRVWYANTLFLRSFFYHYWMPAVEHIVWMWYAQTSICRKICNVNFWLGNDFPPKKSFQQNHHSLA